MRYQNCTCSHGIQLIQSGLCINMGERKSFYKPFCLCSKSFDLYSRKDKSNIICWETIILLFMINLSSNKVILLFQNILSGCDCETCGPGDLFIAHGVKCPNTYLPDLIHLKNSRATAFNPNLVLIAFGACTPINL